MAVMEHVAETLADQLDPAVEKLQENARRARKAMLQAQHKAEDFAAGTALQVRRRPLSAIALAALSAGILCGITGCVIGFAAGRCARDA